MANPFPAALTAAASLLLAVPLLGAPVPALAPPPATRAEPVRETLHGVEVADPYRWLEDQTSPETRKWIAEQNAYTASLLSAAPGRDRLKGRLSALLKVDVLGVPKERAGRYFFTKRLADRDLPVLCARKGTRGKDEVLLDPHPLSPDHTTSFSLLDISADGRLVAYGVRVGGEDEVTVRFREVETGRDRPDVLPRARYSGVAFDGAGGAVYYSRRLAEGPRVFRHRMGSEPAADEKLFGDEYGPEKIVSVGTSDDARYLLIVVLHGSAAEKTEVYFRDLSRGGPIVTVVNDLPARFEPRIGGGRMYLQTNWDAPNGRVLAVDLARPAREHWQEVVPEGGGAIQDVALAGGRLFVRDLHEVIGRIRIFAADGKAMGQIALPQMGSLSNVEGDWGKNEAFFTFTSFLVPTEIYRYDIARGARSVWFRSRVPLSKARVDVRQVRYVSGDGTSIPMFLVHRRDLRLDGENPTLLTGYGGFTISQTPAFSARAALWVERGGVYALPNLRGGSEFGEKWHRAGMLEQKQNTFDDFLAAAEWLIEKKYTSPARLAISGGSNGGLLVGAAMTQRPELFGAVVCSYPLLDMVRYHRFLVAGYWVPEYGSSDDAAQFKTLHAYSPYHRVVKGTRYPAVLFVTGDADTRVDPLHARKMTALLQASIAREPARPVLLHYDTKAGHSRGVNTPVTKQIADLTDELSFLFWQVEMERGARVISLRRDAAAERADEKSGRPLRSAGTVSSGRESSPRGCAGGEAPLREMALARGGRAASAARTEARFASSRGFAFWPEPRKAPTQKAA